MTHEDLKLLIASQLPNNTSNIITPARVRSALNALVDSCLESSMGAFTIDAPSTLQGASTDIGVRFYFNHLHRIPIPDRGRYAICVDYYSKKCDRKVVRGSTPVQYHTVVEKKWRASLNGLIGAPKLLSDPIILPSDCSVGFYYETLMGEYNDHRDAIIRSDGNYIQVGADHGTPIGFRLDVGTGFFTGRRPYYGYKRMVNVSKLGVATNPLPCIYVRGAVVRYTGKSSTPTLAQIAGAYERVCVSSPVRIIAMPDSTGESMNGIVWLDFQKI